MVALFFIIVGMFFFVIVFKSLSSGELKGRGWGFSIRIYQRDSEPFMYWLNFIGYLMAAVFATVFGILKAYKSFF